MLVSQLKLSIFLFPFFYSENSHSVIYLAVVVNEVSVCDWSYICFPVPKIQEEQEEEGEAVVG